MLLIKCCVLHKDNDCARADGSASMLRQSPWIDASASFLIPAHVWKGRSAELTATHPADQGPTAQSEEAFDDSAASPSSSGAALLLSLRDDNQEIRLLQTSLREIAIALSSGPSDGSDALELGFLPTWTEQSSINW